MDALGEEKFIYLYEADSVGSRVTSTVTCLSPEDCRAKDQAWLEKKKLPPSRVDFFFTNSSGPNLRDGVWAMTGFEKDNLCTAAESGTFKLELQGDMLTAELRAAAGDVPRGARGCSTDDAKKALAGQPCRIRKVVRAKIHSTF